LSLRIPLTNDQTLQTEFHEIERRLRKLEKSLGRGGTTTILSMGGGGGGNVLAAPTVDLSQIEDRLSTLETIVDGLDAVTIPVFGPVGTNASSGIVPSPEQSDPPSEIADQYLQEDTTWSFPLRGLVFNATNGVADIDTHEVVDLHGGLHVGAVSASDVMTGDLHVFGSLFYEQQTWDDLRFPAQGINPPGAASDPGVDDDTGLLVFSGTLDNVMVGAAQMPHTWRWGSPVYPHLHLRFPTSAAADTRWLFEYDVADIGEDFVNASGTYTSLATITVPNPQNVNKHVVAEFGALPMTGLEESAIILWKVTRLALSDGADTDTNDCLLIEFDIHFELGQPGSTVQFP